MSDLEITLIAIVILLIVMLLWVLKSLARIENARVRHLNTIIMNIDAEFYAQLEVIQERYMPLLEEAIDKDTDRIRIIKARQFEIDLMCDEIHAKYRYTRGEL